MLRTKYCANVRVLLKCFCFKYQNILKKYVIQNNTVNALTRLTLIIGWAHLVEICLEEFQHAPSHFTSPFLVLQGFFFPAH